MYGLIVIGDDLSSYVAAAVASANGIKTALLSENGAGDICVIDGHTFRIDHTPFTGFDADQIGSSLLKELGIPIEAASLDPAFQIILPENRLDFFNDKEALIKEIAREFPELTASIKSFYDNVEKNSAAAVKWLHEHPLIQPRSFRDWLDNIKLIPSLIQCAFSNIQLKKIMSQNASFKKIIEVQRALLSFDANERHSIFSYYQYEMPLRGAYHLANGRQDFLDALTKKIEMANGIYVGRCEVLSVKKGRIIEVTYNNSDGAATRIEADNLIISTKWPHRHLIIERKKNLNFGDFIRPVKISHYPFTIHLGVNPRCLPEKMAKHVAVITDVNKDIYDDNLIILHTGISGDAANASPANIPLSATVFLPNTDDAWTQGNLIRTSDSIIGRLEDFLPFLKENILFFNPEESMSISKKQRDIINPKYSLRNALFSGFAAKSNKTRFGNIYLTGASLMTDIGLEGEIISGINAAARVTAKRK